MPDSAVSVGFHEAARGVLSHHMVIRDGKVANYQPYPPTPWNANPRDSYGTPGPYEDAVQNTPIFEENGPDDFKGVDIMRAVHSFDPCLPCGVHMYTGKGKVRKVMHTPDGPLLRAMDAESALVARVEELTAQLDDRRRGARRRADGALRGGPRADLGRARRGDARGGSRRTA